MKMGEYTVTALACFLVISQLPFGLTLKPTVPAFLWTPHENGVARTEVDYVNYQTLSPKDLAKSVMTEGGWSSLLCSGMQAENHVDLALVFVGKELQSSDIALNSEPSSMDFLKVPFLNANHSLAYPYIAGVEGKENMETLLISEFVESCGNNFGAGKIAITESCSIDGDNYEKLADVTAVNDYLVSRMEKKQKGQTDLVVFCPGSSQSERQSFSNLLRSVEKTAAKYSVLYVSDPIKSTLYPTYRELGRFLAESSAGNDSSTCDGVCQVKSSLLEGLLVLGRFLAESSAGNDSSTCDGVCQVKSSLLEGLLVGLVLLIILISGLCCMAGIDTPARFEAPIES